MSDIEECRRYFDKCRCCYGGFEGGDASTEINKVIEKRFFFLSNIEVKYSTFLLSCIE